MQAKGKRSIKGGREYDQYFQAAMGQVETLSQVTDTDDTIAKIKRNVLKQYKSTGRLADTLKGKELGETCKNIWNFCYTYIQYQLDTPGVEEIETPAYIWSRRETDCDGYTTIISCLLLNLKIPHFLRVTAYSGDWQHIYIIVPKSGDVKAEYSRFRNRRDYFVIDPVTDANDYEAPYTDKLDTPMELKLLSGLGNLPPASDQPEITMTTRDTVTGAIIGFDKNGEAYIYEPAQGGGIAGSELGLFKKIGAAIKKAADNAGDLLRDRGIDVKATIKKVGDTVGKGVRFVNRFVNPATILIRNGWLIAMKVDLFNVAQTLRWGYADWATVSRHTNLSQGEWDKLKRKAEDIEIIYWQVGGERSNLKRAILTGNGNRNREVPADNSPVTQANDQEELALLNAEANTLQGLGFLGLSKHERMFHKVYGSMTKKQRQDLMNIVRTPEEMAKFARYVSSYVETHNQLRGLGGLGEVATGTALAAVSGAVAGVAAGLKPILDTLKRGKEVVADVKNTISPFLPQGAAQTPGAPSPTASSAPATQASFNEAAYLAANPDVAAVVRAGQFDGSGYQHYLQFGQREGRPLYPATVNAQATVVATAPDATPVVVAQPVVQSGSNLPAPRDQDKPFYQQPAVLVGGAVAVVGAGIAAYALTRKDEKPAAVSGLAGVPRKRRKRKPAAPTTPTPRPKAKAKAKAKPKAKAKSKARRLDINIVELT